MARFLFLRRRLATVAALATALVAAACEFNTTAIAPPRASVVVHAVLNPALSQQMLLLERTLTGVLEVDATRFDPSSPIASGGGVPIEGAEVSMQSESGARWVAASAGGGVYLFATGPGSRLTPGLRYSLRIRTPEGEIVTGEAQVPATSAAPALPVRTFDRESDTLHIQWPAVPGARSYALRVDAPTGPFYFFVDSLSMRLPGGLRNLFAPGIPRVFIPGFRQVVTVSAVDVNYFDYYRSRSDAFTGTGQITHLDGAIGFFGASVNVFLQRLDVVAPFRAFPEGQYELARGPGPLALHVWIERPATATQPALLTGRYLHVVRSEPGAFIGTLVGNHVTLTLLNGQMAGDTLETFRGEVRGDSIVGSFPDGATSVYYRR
jgi:hypothetical protein